MQSLKGGTFEIDEPKINGFQIPVQPSFPFAQRNEQRARAAHAVEERNHLRHRRHLDTLGQQPAGNRADDDGQRIQPKWPMFRQKKRAEPSASAMPMAATMLPERAVRGELRRFNPK
jgi:hypothetical protein